MQEGNEVRVGAKTERTDTDRTFILFVLCPLSHSLSISHTHSEEMEASYWARLILAGELRANPVR